MVALMNKMQTIRKEIRPKQSKDHAESALSPVNFI